MARYRPGARRLTWIDPTADSHVRKAAGPPSANDAATHAHPGARHLRGDRVLCLPDGSPINASVIKAVAALRHRGSSRACTSLRHKFVHTGDEGARRGIQDLAVHADLSTTQRYSILVAATEDSIRCSTDDLGSKASQFLRHSGQRDDRRELLRGKDELSGYGDRTCDWLGKQDMTLF